MPDAGNLGTVSDKALPAMPRYCFSRCFEVVAEGTDVMNTFSVGEEVIMSAYRSPRTIHISMSAPCCEFNGAMQRYP